MDPAPPILEYGKPQALPLFAWQSIYGGIIGFVGPQMFMCMCGYIQAMGLVTTVPAAFLGWWGFSRRLSLPGRIIAGCIAIFVSLILLKNILDVGWFGHEPLFR